MPDGFHIRSLGAKVPRKNESLAKTRTGQISWMRAVLGSVVGSIAGLLQWLQHHKQRLGTRRFIMRVVGTLVIIMIAYVAILWLTLPSISDPNKLWDEILVEHYPFLLAPEVRRDHRLVALCVNAAYHNSFFLHFLHGVRGFASEVAADRPYAEAWRYIEANYPPAG